MEKIRLLFMAVLVSLLMTAGVSYSQFIDHFDNAEIHPDWQTFSGDGEVDIHLDQGEEHGKFTVDATDDKMNLWWAVIKRQINELDLQKLAQPEYELRVEAKIKSSHAPRRVNLHFNHQRTTDFHSHLKEFDVGDTTSWHVISMTTDGFDARPGDNINVQMALMDWGTDKYMVQIDYLKVDVVDPKTSGPDLGNPQTYHPEIPPLHSFEHEIEIEQDAVIDKMYPEKNFHAWHDPLQPEAGNLLPVSHEQLIILKTGLENYRKKLPEGVAVLKLNLHHLERSPALEKDFGMVRLVEIIDGDQNWNEEKVTYASFLQDKPVSMVFNNQMIIDVDVSAHKNKEVYFTLSEAVMQRLFNGQTTGLAVFPLGSVHASFYGSESLNDALRPKLFLNVK